MKKIIIFVLILLIVVAGYYIYQKFDKPKLNKITNFAECAAAGNPIMESYPRKCNANGQTFTESTTGQKEDLIRVTKPGILDLVENPIQIEGEAKGFWFFEASFPVKLVDVDGKILGTGIAKAESEWMTENFVLFKAELTYSADSDGSGRIILQRDNPSVLPQNDDSFEIPVRYQKTGDKMKIKLYFQNSELDAATDYDCGKTIGVEREVDKTSAVAKTALEELLKGPSDAEKQIGFTTQINDGVKLQSVTIDDNGVAKADFSAELEKGVGGSCKVSAIRAQIEATLKQFSSVKSVVISINGKTEDILQP